MSHSRLVLALLLANLLAVLLLYRDVADLGDRVDRLQGAVAGAAAQHATAAAQALQPAPAVRAPAAASAEPASSVEVQAQADGAESAALDLDDLAAIKSQFDGQYSDALRTAQIHQAIQSVSSASANYTAITHDLIDCKEKICKLVLGYSDTLVFDAFVDDLTMALKGGLSASLYFDAPRELGGYSTVDVYLVRE